MKNLKLEGLKKLSKEDLAEQARLYEIKINGLKNRVKRFKKAEHEFRSLIKTLKKKSKLQDKLIEGYKRKAEAKSKNIYAFDIVYKDLVEYITENDIKEMFFVFDRILKVVLHSDEIDFYTAEVKSFSFFHSLIRDIVLAENKEPAA